MKPCPNVWTLKSLLHSVHSAQAQINNKWVPARPLGLLGLELRIRLKAAWVVFLGKADVVVWPEGQQNI